MLIPDLLVYLIQVTIHVTNSLFWAFPKVSHCVRCGFSFVTFGKLRFSKVCRSVRLYVCYFRKTTFFESMSVSPFVCVFVCMFVCLLHFLLTLYRSHFTEYRFNFFSLDRYWHSVGLINFWCISVQ